MGSDTRPRRRPPAARLPRRVARAALAATHRHRGPRTRFVPVPVAPRRCRAQSSLPPAPSRSRMSFTIHGLGTANPPASVSTEEALGIARLLAGPDVRTSTWLGPIYAGAGVARRFQVIGGLAMRDAFDGTRHSDSPFLPTPEHESVGPTTAVRMQRYAKEAGPLALRASAIALAESAFSPDSITHLVTVSCTGFVAPGVDLALIN